MKFLIVLLSAFAITLAKPYETSDYEYHGPPAPLGHDGRVVDTPEVAQAKAAHLAALAEATSKATYGSPSYLDSGEYSNFASPVSVSNQMYHSGYGYRGPLAPLDHEGRVIDTPEVAQAKAAHFAAYQHAASKIASFAPVEHYQGAYSAPIAGYHGPPAPLSNDGRVVDTPEVAHAKAAHFAAYSKTFGPSYY